MAMPRHSNGSRGAPVRKSKVAFRPGCSRRSPSQARSGEMPSTGTTCKRAAQWRAGGGAEERLFGHRLELQRLPRLRAALERLFEFVAGAGVSCRTALGASTLLLAGVTILLGQLISRLKRRK